MGKVVVHYFSGTGNTAHAVDLLAAALKAKKHAVTLKGMDASPVPTTGAVELHVVAFPTYAWYPPALVLRYCRRLPRVAAGTVRAAVFTTYGGNPVGAADRAAAILRRRGYDVFLVGGALYPDNWTQFVNPPDEARCKELRKQGDAMTKEFGKALVEGTPGRVGAPGPAPWAGVVGRLFLLFGRRVLGKFFFADSTCIGCAKCARSCPVACITMRGKGAAARPRWGLSCIDCCRCINVCPTRSLQVSLSRIVVAGLAHVAALAALVATFHPLAALFPSVHWTLVLAGALVAGTVVLLALTVWVLNPLVGLVGKVPGLRRLGETALTRRFNRYWYPGFKP